MRRSKYVPPMPFDAQSWKSVAIGDFFRRLKYEAGLEDMTGLAVEEIALDEGVIIEDVVMLTNEIAVPEAVQSETAATDINSAGVVDSIHNQVTGRIYLSRQITQELLIPAPTQPQYAFDGEFVDFGDKKVFVPKAA